MELYILATSDVHAYVMPTDYMADSYNTNLGLAKASAVIEAVRREHEHVVYIDNGDLIQGSALAQYWALNHGEEGPQPIVSCLNAMGCDAAVLGNHEFNYGKAYLARGVAAAHFPVLAANVIEQDTGEPLFDAYTIIRRGPIKIAVLGLITEFVPQWEKEENIDGLKFEDPILCAQKWVPRLREMADVVIVSYHGGFERDPFSGRTIGLQPGENVAEKIIEAVPDIDCLITGHQHREIYGIHQGVPIVMPGWRAQAVGLVHLILKEDRQGRWQVSAHEAMLLKNGRVAADPRITERIKPIHDEVESWLDIPIGHVEGNMLIDDALAARTYVHPYVEFINRIQMQAAGVDISCTSIFRGDARGLPPDITVRHIVNNYIYTNTLAVLEVSGDDLRAALERCAQFFDLDENNQLMISKAFSTPFIQYYNYDIYSGIDYTMDIRKEPGERITHLSYHGQDIKGDDKLKIVMNNYRAIGGGQYPMYNKSKIVQDIQIDMTDLMLDYIIRHPVIHAQNCHQFKVIY